MGGNSGCFSGIWVLFISIFIIVGMGLDKIDHTLPCHPLLHLVVYLCSVMHFPSKSLHACIHIDAGRWSFLCPSESYVQDVGFFPTHLIFVKFHLTFFGLSTLEGQPHHSALIFSLRKMARSLSFVCNPFTMFDLRGSHKCDTAHLVSKTYRPDFFC